MKIRVLLRGVLGYFPWILKPFRKGTGGTSSARYCYSVWLRHLILLKEHGMIEMPKVVAEIGPGDSLGIGLNALITGSENYLAFDIIKHANTQYNLKIFDELIELYKEKNPIPDDREFPRVRPPLKGYDFPSHILSDTELDRLLRPERLNKIRKAIASNQEDGGITIKYIVSWDEQLNVDHNSVDLIYSQAVMEHVMDVKSSYQTMYKWLKHGGLMLHEIDYSAHETHADWYGHWRYPFWLWKVIMKGRSYYINRYPNSYHINALADSNFRILMQLPNYNSEAKLISKSLKDKIPFTKDDVKISSNYIIAKKQ